MNFEQAVELLEANTKDPFVLGRHLADLASGLRNAADRIEAIERTRHEDLTRIAKIESLTTEERAWVDAIARDRTTLQGQVKELQDRCLALENRKPDVPSYTAPAEHKTAQLRS